MWRAGAGRGTRSGVRRRTVRHPLPLLLALAAVAGCALAGPSIERWEASRRDVVEPLNATFHKHLPRHVAAHDLEALVALHASPELLDQAWDGGEVVAPELDERVVRWRAAPSARSVRAHWEHVLALFPEVERAELRILRVHWDEPGTDGLRTDARLLVRGGDGPTLRQLEQEMTLWIARRDGPWKITRAQVQHRQLVSSDRPAFESATARAAIADVHDTTGSPPFRVIGGAYNSSGVAVGDVDGDGDEDAVLVSASRLALYRNRDDGTFAEATREAGLPATFPGVGTGALLFDYDNDGWPDLYVASIGPRDRLYRNDGGVFRDVTEAAGILPAAWSSMVIAADYDRDGDLDVYVTRMGDHERIPPNPNYDALNGIADALYRNEGDGTFTDVAAAAGVACTGWGLAAAWGDYDGDGWPDLYVGNEFGPNKLFRNRGDGTFEDVSIASGTADRGATMGVAWGDVDGDGDLDLYASNMFANSSWLLFHPDFPRPVPWYLRPFVERIHQVTDEITRGSTLFLNDGDGTFTDASDAAGVRDGQWGWGAEFLDYDNDGRLDLYATNGFVSGPREHDV